MPSARGETLKNALEMKMLAQNRAIGVDAPVRQLCWRRALTRSRRGLAPTGAAVGSPQHRDIRKLVVDAAGATCGHCWQKSTAFVVEFQSTNGEDDRLPVAQAEPCAGSGSLELRPPIRIALGALTGLHRGCRGRRRKADHRLPACAQAREIDGSSALAVQLTHHA